MEKFDVLRTNRVFMKLFGLYSNRLTEPTNEFFKSIGAHLVLITCLLTVIASIVGILDLEVATYRFMLDAILIIIAMSASFVFFLSVGIKMKHIKAVHLQLQSIVDTGYYFLLHFIYRFNPYMD